MKRVLCALSILLGIFCQETNAKNYELTSPDGSISVSVDVEEGIAWSMYHCDDALIVDSPISMTLSGEVVYGDADKVLKVTRKTVDQVHQTHIYRKSQVQDTYNEMTLKFKEFSLIFRAYADGAAYRFISHSKVPFEVS